MNTNHNLRFIELVRPLADRRGIRMPKRQRFGGANFGYHYKYLPEFGQPGWYVWRYNGDRWAWVPVSPRIKTLLELVCWL